MLVIYKKRKSIFLTDRIVPSQYEREDFIMGKDTLVEDMNNRIDISLRQMTGKRGEK